MPYTPPATVITGTTITSAWGNSVKAALDFLANPPAARVYNSADQSIANNSGAVAAFNAERFDTDTMHDTVTNNSRITIKTAGLYIVTFTGQFTVGSDYIYTYAGFRLNGATDVAYNENYPEQGGNTVDARISVTTVYKCAVNDYLQVVVAQRNGAAAARNLLATGNYSPEFAATWIGLG